MQDRIGANRADIFGIRAIGLLHPAADVLKLLTKEDVVPRGANRVLHLLAPVIAIVPAIITLAVIPFGGVYQFGDTSLNLVVADIDWGMLYVLAVGSIATYGAVIAGWASNNNWSLLGSMRASSQMISYEVTMGLSLVGLFMVFGTLRLPEMAIAQDTTFRLLGFLELFGWLDRAAGLARSGSGSRPGGSSSSRSASSSSSPASWPRTSGRPSTRPRASRRSSPATTWSTRGCASACSTRPSSSRCR